jgi:hypothetical protein
MGGRQSWSGHGGYRKNPLPLPEINSSSPGRPARCQTLYRLSYPAPTKSYKILLNDILFAGQSLAAKTSYGTDVEEDETLEADCIM